jgi:hypothetical protein
MTTTILSRANVTLPIKNIDHPLDKIFGGIPAGSSELTHASVRHYFPVKNPLDSLKKVLSYIIRL